MKRWQSDGALLLIVMLWGSTFFVVRSAVQSWAPLYFLALRFGLALLALLPLALPDMRRWRRTDLLAGLALSLPLFVGFATQTYGLKLISAARGGFITGLNVVLVPVLALLIWRQRAGLQVWLGVLLAVGGMFWLTRDELAASTPLGDALVLICAVMFALHILLTGRLSPGRNALALNVVQIGVTALLALLAGLLLAPAPPQWSWSITGSAAYLGVICTALILMVQTLVQRHTTPTHTALVFALEPVFAALFAAMFADEPLTPTLLVGGALMLAGIILAELPPLRRRILNH